MTYRQQTGIPILDQALGGGLLPGTLTIIAGATGVGKTQLGIRWCAGDRRSGEAPGALIDLSSRGDSQSHDAYALRIADWEIVDHPLERLEPNQVFDSQFSLGHRLTLMGYEGKRVLRSQLDDAGWNAWQCQLNRRTPAMTEFVYRHRIRGTRRFLVDGIEPQEDPSDSLQLDILEMIYHRMIRQQSDWLARELFRQDYRRMEPMVMSHAYEQSEASVVVMLTTKETMLDQLLAKPWADGDLAAGANTIIVMGRISQGNRLGRALHVAKHRGSPCDDSIFEFTIDHQGLQIGLQP